MGVNTTRERVSIGIDAAVEGRPQGVHRVDGDPAPTVSEVRGASMGRPLSPEERGLPVRKG